MTLIVPGELAGRPWINVKDPEWAGGATGDGQTDDTAAFLAADAFNAGKAVTLVPGSQAAYRLSNSATIANPIDLTVAAVSVDAGKTLTITGPLKSMLSRQAAFPGAGTVALNGPSQFAAGAVSQQSVAFSATITPDATLGEDVVVGTLTGNITVANPANAQKGQKLRLYFQQDATGGRTVTFGSNYKASWTPSTTANLRNTISFECLDGTIWVQTAATTGLPA